MTALFHRCRFHALRGDLQQGYELSQQALQRAHESGGAALPLATFAHASLGRITLEWNELDQAVEHLTQMIRLGEATGFVTGNLSSGTTMLAEVQQARGNTTAANDLMQQAISYAERYDPPAEVAWLKVYQARLWLAQRNIAASAQWLRAAKDQSLPPSMFYPNNIQTVTRARVLLAQRKADEAVSLLTPLVAGLQDQFSVEAWATLALARQAQGDSTHAALALEQALTLAGPENRVRVFLDLGQPLGKLLDQFLAAHPDHSFAQQLQAALLQPIAATPLIEPLSDRELEVLKLIVAGYSNEEIARQLTLAQSTVKWYVNTLYGKLHVKTRSQAIARTRELRLLPD
jgi:LuxR family maltose regulon positive regulatory protein